MSVVGPRYANDIDLATIDRLDNALALVRQEYLSTLRFAPLASAHEGYAVLAQGLDDLWEEIKRGRPIGARDEAVQLAAMAVRFLINIKGKE